MPEPTQRSLAAQTEDIRQRAAIQQIETDMTSLCETLETVTYWRPAATLAQQGREMVSMIGQLHERLDKKLVVTFIGPSGAGKSTLLNALAGVDELSPTGRDRPTTHQPLVLCRQSSDADQLIQKLGQKHVTIHSDHTPGNLDHLILVDTPDTDSNELEHHIPLVQKAIALSDVLICVFDAENPKRRDQIDFLTPYVQRFSGDALAVVLNKCDRQHQKELQTTILPQLKEILSAAWQMPINAVLGISARRYLQQPQFDDTARPRHDFDQFNMLQRLLTESLNPAGLGANVRLANTKQIKTTLLKSIAAEIEKDRATLQQAAKAIQTAEEQAFDAAVTALNNAQRHLSLGVNVMLYHELAQRWSGPVGWLIALWARILMFGSGMAAVFRPGNPLRNLWGLFKTWRQYKESRSAKEETEGGKGSRTAVENYRRTLQQEWPDVAERLIKGRFNPIVRQAETTPPSITAMDNALSGAWEKALSDTLDRFANGLSYGLLQLLFNLPAVVILIYVGWLTGMAFFTKNYLASEFFIHALMTAGLALFLAFFLYQAIVRIFAGPKRLMHKTLEAVNQTTAILTPRLEHPVAKEIETLARIDQGIRQTLNE